MNPNKQIVVVVIKAISAVVAATSLSSCLSSSQLADMRQEYLNGLRQRCLQYGITDGTQQMAQCIMQIDQQNILTDRMAQQQREAEALRNAQTPITAPNQKR
jgi:hypothetical protein